MEVVPPVIINWHVKYPIFSAKEDEDAESHLLNSSDWINSQGIADDAKCGGVCLAHGHDANLGNHKKSCFKDGDPFSLMRQLTQCLICSKVETVCSNIRLQMKVKS